MTLVFVIRLSLHTELLSNQEDTSRLKHELKKIRDTHSLSLTHTHTRSQQPPPQGPQLSLLQAHWPKSTHLPTSSKKTQEPRRRLTGENNAPRSWGIPAVELKGMKKLALIKPNQVTSGHSDDQVGIRSFLTRFRQCQSDQGEVSRVRSYSGKSRKVWPGYDCSANSAQPYNSTRWERSSK